MNKRLFIAIQAIFMILLTLSSALAVEILSTSQMDYVDGQYNTMQRKFTMIVTETPTGSDKIAAGDMRDSISKEYATKDFIMNTQMKEYSCDYKFLANTNPDDKEKYYYTYYVTGNKGNILAGDLTNCMSTDVSKNPYLKDTAFMAELSKTPGQKLYTTFLLKDAIISLPYCAAIIQQTRYNAGVSTLPAVTWKADWTVNNGNEYTQTKTISSSDISKQISLTTSSGKEVAKVQYIASLGQPENRCPEASADQKRAIQGYSSNRWDFIPYKTHLDIYNSELKLKTDVYDWYANNFAWRFLLTGFYGTLSKTELQTKFDTLHNNLVSNIRTDNTLIGTETCNVVDGGNGKICALTAVGKFPYIPLYKLEIQADWVGVIRPEAIPAIKLIDTSVTFVANEQKTVQVEVSNVGSDRGQFSVGLDGTCDPSTVYVDRTSTGYIEAGGKTTVILKAGSTVNKAVSGSCNICAVGNDPTKKACQKLSINVKPTTDCGGEGAQQCFGTVIYQCSEALGNFDMTRPVLTCNAGDACVDYKRDATVSKYAAKCVGSNVDECKENVDCEIKLAPKDGFDRVCSVPLVGIKTCKYVPLTTTKCNDGIDNDDDGKIDMQDKGCTEPKDNDEKDGIDWMPWIALLGLIGFITFGALTFKADDDGNDALKFIFGALAVISGIALIYAIFIWLGLITMLLIAVGLTAITVGRFLLKLVPQAGAIAMIIGLVLLLIAGIIIIIKLFLATSAIGTALKFI